MKTIRVVDTSAVDALKSNSRSADEVQEPPEKGISSMTWLRNLPIARKFTLAFGIVCGPVHRARRLHVLRPSGHRGQEPGSEHQCFSLGHYAFRTPAAG
jgi:hypothetical protein